MRFILTTVLIITSLTLRAQTVTDSLAKACVGKYVWSDTTANSCITVYINAGGTFSSTGSCCVQPCLTSGTTMATWKIEDGKIVLPENYFFSDGKLCFKFNQYANKNCCEKVLDE